MPRFAAQPRTVAFGTRLVVQVFGELLAHHHRIGLAIAALEIGNDALERVLLDERPAALGYVRERNLLVAGAVEDHVLHALGQFRERPVDIKADVLRDALQHLKVKLVAPIPTLDGARRERKLRERDDALRIEKGDCAQPVAARARSQRIVE